MGKTLERPAPLAIHCGVLRQFERAIRCLGVLLNMALKPSACPPCVLSLCAVLLSSISPSLADSESSSVAHVAAGPYGRCYAKSVPRHVYDPQGGTRQQGRTEIYRVGDPDDVRVTVYDWFSQRLFIKCSPPNDETVVRVGPWQRGHVPSAEHLAIAFYRNGELLKRYSTLDIAGDEPAKNVAVSVSHYAVFESGPEMVSVTTSSGPMFKEELEIRARTVDGRDLVFDMTTGELQ